MPFNQLVQRQDPKSMRVLLRTRSLPELGMNRPRVRGSVRYPLNYHFTPYKTVVQWLILTKNTKHNPSLKQKQVSLYEAAHWYDPFIVRHAKP